MGAHHGAIDLYFLLYYFDPLRGVRVAQYGGLTMPKLTPEEIKKRKDERQRTEWFGMLRRIVSMAFFHAIFGRDRRK